MIFAASKTIVQGPNGIRAWIKKGCGSRMQNGTYCVTVCVKDGHFLFGKVQDGTMVLSENGEHVRRYVEMIETIYPSVMLDDYVVMPNHLHILLVMLDYKVNPSLQRVVGQFKAAVTKQIGFSPWQDNSYISAILTARRNRAVRRYIKENPAHWEKDKFYMTECE